MLKVLDPHSIFFDPGQFEQLKQMQHSESKGFGSIVSVLPGRVIVLQAMEGTPSAKSGLTPRSSTYLLSRSQPSPCPATVSGVLKWVLPNT